MKTIRLFLLGVILLTAGAAQAEEILLSSVPFIPQSPPGSWQHTLNCGPVSSLLAASYQLGFTPTSDDTKKIVEWMYESRYIHPQTNGADYYDGNVTNIWQAEAILSGYFDLPDTEMHYSDATSYVDYIKEALMSDSPLIVAVNLRMDPSRMGHFMLVVGINDSEIIVHDPGKTRGAFNRYSLRQFERSWRTSRHISLKLVNKKVAWHPNGTLIKAVGDSKVYVLIDDSKAWIKNMGVFNGHNFDERKIITVSQDELNCYRAGGNIDWAPYRETFQLDDEYFLMERYTENSFTCTTYGLSGELSYLSWNLPWPVERVSRRVAEERYFHQCSDGTVLYLRAGTLIKPMFPLPDFGCGVIFVAEENGILRPFASEALFNMMGYRDLPIYLVGEQEFFHNFSHYGAMITPELARQCLSPSDTASASFALNDDKSDGGVRRSPIRRKNGPPFYARQWNLSGAVVERRQVDGGVVLDGGIIIDGGVQLDGGVSSSNAQNNDEPVNCSITCPDGMKAYIWYGVFGQASGSPSAQIHSTQSEICGRGRAWIDFNCACPNWSCFDWSVANVECDHPFNKMPGVVDPRGEGEVWFTDFSCNN